MDFTSAPMLLTWLLLFLPNLFFLTVTAGPLFSCLDYGNYSHHNSTYRFNLDAAFSTLSTNIDANGFSYASAGNPHNEDWSNAMVLCKADIQLHECRDCLQNSILNLPTWCPFQKQAILWYGNCMLRYSNETIYKTRRTWPSLWGRSPFNDSSPVRFRQDVTSLLDDIRNRAINGGSQKKVAAGRVLGPDSLTIYAFMQCTPDISLEDCSSCLSEAAGDVPMCCSTNNGGRILKPSCNVRFEIYPFFNESNLQGLVVVPATAFQKPQSPVSSPASRYGGNKTRVVITIVASLVTACVVVAIAVAVLLRRNKIQNPTGELETIGEISTIESLQYPFSTIKASTSDFSDANKLGQGGFGAVYKGILPNGKEIAVKRLSSDSRQGDLGFKNEVQLLASVQHKNLVRLLGFSIQGAEKLLVYELVPNGSLERFIFDATKDSYLDWDTRFKIIEGVARGLLYLHEDSQLKIIHRDLKATNILLDIEMAPKIADFGVAKLFGVAETHESTERIVGTYGYMPPEYAMYGQFSVKSDVFSFGVLTLEIISGKMNNNGHEEPALDLLSFAWKKWCEGTGVDIIDPHLRSSSGSITDILKCIHISLLCVQQNAQDRPTMDLVVLMLDSFSVSIAVPSEPAYYIGSDSGAVTASSQDENNSVILADHQSDEHESKNDLSITELSPR